MTGQCDKPSPHGWTLDTLERFLSSRIDALDKFFTAETRSSKEAVQSALAAVEKQSTAAMAAAEKAISKSDAATEKRFDCVEASTPILCADLVWRAAGDLVAGNELIAFDEESPTRRGRMFRKSIVIANSSREDNILRVTTPLGNVCCNHDHPWLVRRLRSTRSRVVDGVWEWVKSSDLQIGDEVLHTLDVWKVDTSWESGWLAGMFDGEGCLSIHKTGTAQLSLAQRESKTSTKIGAALKNRDVSFCSHRQEAGTRSTRYNTLPFFHFIISTRSDVMKILGSVRPPRLMPKAHKVWDGKPIGGKHRRTVITSIESVGVGTVAVLGTSTRTYIAGGFAMHNSVNEFRKTLSDQAADFLSRKEYEANHKALEEKLGVVSDRAAKLETQKEAKTESVSFNVTVILGIFAALSALGNIVSVIFILTKGAPP